MQAKTWSPVPSAFCSVSVHVSPAARTPMNVTPSQSRRLTKASSATGRTLKSYPSASMVHLLSSGRGVTAAPMGPRPGRYCWPGLRGLRAGCDLHERGEGVAAGLRGDRGLDPRAAVDALDHAERRLVVAELVLRGAVGL